MDWEMGMGLSLGGVRVSMMVFFGIFFCFI
jgi:hypothetical protein